MRQPNPIGYNYRMMQIENESKKRTRNEKLMDLVIGSVGVAGTLAVALLAPNVLQALPKLGLTPKPRQKEYIASARRRAVQEGYLREHSGLLRITKRGKHRLGNIVLRMSQPPKQKRWDEKWRVLIFDIPERRRSARSHVRRILSSAGFERLQDSVWAYPYPCEEYVALLKANARVGKDLLYLVVDAIDPHSDLNLRRVFGLQAPRVASSPRFATTRSSGTKYAVVTSVLDTLFGPPRKHDNFIL